MPVLVSFRAFRPESSLYRGIKTHLRNPQRFIQATVVQNVITYKALTTRKLIGLFVFALILLSFKSDNYFIPDDYPVTNEMFKNCQLQKDIDGVFSFDKAWFKNQDLGEVLIFELYTDYHRLAIYHCKSEFLISDLIKQVELHRKTGMSTFDLADEEKKQKVFKKFFDNSEEIDKSYFKTKQDIRLGISKSDALKKYGNHSMDTIINNIAVLKWDFQGSYAIAETGEKPKGKVAKDSFGFHVVMYFKMDKLVAMILKNDIL
jgi:hypothetical protein